MRIDKNALSVALRGSMETSTRGESKLEDTLEILW